MSDYFQSQTNVITFDIDFKILFEAWQIIFPVDELFGFIDTRMIY